MSLSMAQAAIRCVRAVKARALGVRAGLPRRTFRMTRPRWGLDEFFYSGPAASGLFMSCPFRGPSCTRFWANSGV
eukprot:1361174-Amorphochlora_amoeboformis.AAC.1